ncbi:hypothetical protein DFJ74DRAFT_703554 [Hyaloraphidium curvatum]|nr:hypothetical protein DFJ74DRAFT_703554 [Hyaloraphidium curvatum]
MPTDGGLQLSMSPQPVPPVPRIGLATVPEETIVVNADGDVVASEDTASARPLAGPTEPPSPSSATRNLSASMPRTPRLSTESKPVVLKINLSTSRMNLLNDDPSLYASPVAFYEKLKEVANTSELAGLVAQGDSSFHEELRRLLLSEFDFTNMPVDESLRDFLETFELPKESQQIDRVVAAFANKYHEDNPDVFENADAAHILTFSLLMLNTDLHSPHVKRKMSPSDFINNTRFGPAARSLPAELLEILYENVASVEFRMGPGAAEPGSDSTKRKNWGLGRTAKKLGLKKGERGSRSSFRAATAPPSLPLAVPLDKSGGKKAFQKMLNWATGGSLKKRAGWAMGDIQSAESALDAIDHLMQLSFQAVFSSSQPTPAPLSTAPSQVLDITAGVLAATAVGSDPPMPALATQGSDASGLDASVKRLSLAVAAPGVDARTSESSSTFINSARSIMGSRSGSFASQAQSASYAQPPASMLDPSSVLLHARLNVRKVPHATSASSSSRPPAAAYISDPGNGMTSVLVTSASVSSLQSSLSTSEPGSSLGNAAEDFGAWPLTWVALKNDGTVTLYNPASRKTTILPLEGAVAVWDPWFYRGGAEDVADDSERANTAVPKEAPGCWHLWLPSPPFTKDYVVKGEHAGEWVSAVNAAVASAFFATPASVKVTVDQLSALIRIQNDKLEAIRGVINHLSFLRPLSGKGKRKMEEIVGRKWQEAREVKRDRERYAVFLAELEKRQATPRSGKAADGGEFGTQSRRTSAK